MSANEKHSCFWSLYSGVAVFHLTHHFHGSRNAGITSKLSEWRLLLRALYVQLQLFL